MPQDRLPEIIGSALKNAREKRGMERSELATQCCLSNKMILELEEGGMTAFYSFQLKLSSAKRVGSFLGLSPSDYLEQVVELAEVPDPVVEVEESAAKGGEQPAQASPPKSVVNEGEQLDDLIYQSTNSGISLSHMNMHSIPVRRIGILLGLLIAVGVLYGLNSQFEISTRTLAFLEQIGSKNVVKPEAPKELVIQEPSPEAVDEKAPANMETKPNTILATSVNTTAVQGQCPPIRDAELPVYKSPNASKLGDVVNVKTLVKQSICVSDGQGKQTLIDLEPNTAHAFKGAPPFVISAQDLDNVEMYFQGWRVRSPSPGAKQMKLVEVAVQ
jgi:transcriptional regulator with XRE-family HTH domain